MYHQYRGITDSTIKSLGTIDNELFGNDFSLFHDFHVVPNTFNNPADGIVGKDFITFYECTINYRKMTCFLYLDGRLVPIPMVDGFSDDTLVLPARAEVFKTFCLTKFEQPQFINNFEISLGVFVGNSIANSKFSILKVINTTNEINTFPNSFFIP